MSENKKNNHGIIHKIKKFRDKLKKYAELTEVGEIARRYFVMNAFDGALTTLGIIIGFFLAGASTSDDVRVLVITVLATALAMGISGIWGAYLAERAERKRELQQLERSMMTDLSDSVIARATRFAVILSAVVDGISPALAAVVGILPFFFGLAGGDFVVLFYISIGMNLGILFLLGMFLGRVSKENVLIMGIKVILAGVVVTVILFIVNLIAM